MLIHFLYLFFYPRRGGLFGEGLKREGAKYRYYSTSIPSSLPKHNLHNRLNSTPAHTNERFVTTKNLIKIPILNYKNWRLGCLNAQRYPLSFFLSNVRSLLPKVDELDAILKLNHASLAFITETWLNENIDDAAVQIHGYSLIRRDRKSWT